MNLNPVHQCKHKGKNRGCQAKLRESASSKDRIVNLDSQNEVELMEYKKYEGQIYEI